MSKPCLIAHRGASTQAPENTKAAFLKAWECGVDGIEGDFRLTSDGAIVCFHDADTFRVSAQTLTIAQATLKDLKEIDIGSWYNATFVQERILTLAEVLALVPAQKCVFVEIKVGGEILEELFHQIDTGPCSLQQIKIISFQAEVIAAVKKQYPSIEVFWIVDLNQTPLSQQEILDRLKAISADGLSLNHINVEELLIKNIIESGYSTHLWAVDDICEAQKYLTWGVTSITTNKPEVLKTLFNEQDEI